MLRTLSPQAAGYVRATGAGQSRQCSGCTPGAGPDAKAVSARVMPPAPSPPGTVASCSRRPTTSPACTTRTPTSSDVPLYQVNSQNLAQYQAQLPAGLKALLEKNPDYALRVFSTRRSAAAPQRIYDATRFNALNAELISGGNGVAGVAAGTFPVAADRPGSDLEPHQRYRGDQIQALSPTRRRY